MDILPEYTDLMSVGIAILCGSLIGFEREFRNKAAGFRTVVLICLGSAIFTIISRHGAGSDDRIAANIITGVGFIGAGVIFKGKVSVLGLTTAAVIWITAGIGMAAGAGYHSLAMLVTACTLVILILFSKVELLLAAVHVSSTLYITFDNTDMAHLRDLEQLISDYRIKARRKLISKSSNRLSAVIEVRGYRKHIVQFNEQLVNLPYVHAFNYG